MNKYQIIENKPLTSRPESVSFSIIADNIDWIAGCAWATASGKIEFQGFSRSNVIPAYKYVCASINGERFFLKLENGNYTETTEKEAFEFVSNAHGMTLAHMPKYRLKDGIVVYL